MASLGGLALRGFGVLWLLGCGVWTYDKLRPESPEEHALSAMREIESRVERAKDGDLRFAGCRNDCSGHSAGYVWAFARDLEDPAACHNPSMSFAEGCRRGVLDYRKEKEAFLVWKAAEWRKGWRWAEKRNLTDPADCPRPVGTGEQPWWDGCTGAAVVNDADSHSTP